jgi:hypothetical protein
MQSGDKETVGPQFSRQKSFIGLVPFSLNEAMRKCVEFQCRK